MISRTRKLLKITPKEKRCAWFRLWMLWYTNPDSVNKHRERGKYQEENGNWYQYLCAAVRWQLFPISYVILYYPFWFLFYTGACFFDRSPNTSINFFFLLFSFYTFVFFLSLSLSESCVTMMSLIRVHVKAQYSLLLSFFVFPSLSIAMVKRGCDIVLFPFSSRLISLFLFPLLFFYFFVVAFLPLIIRVYNSCYCHVTIDLEWNIRLARFCQKHPFYCFCLF